MRDSAHVDVVSAAELDGDDASPVRARALVGPDPEV
jgi:hypothetical protein